MNSAQLKGWLRGEAPVPKDVFLSAVELLSLQISAVYSANALEQGLALEGRSSAVDPSPSPTLPE